MKVILSLINIPDDRIGSREPVHFASGCFLRINAKLSQFEFAVSMTGIGIKIQPQVSPVVFGEGFAGGVLEKLVTQATPEADNDHLRAILIIIAGQN